MTAAERYNVPQSSTADHRDRPSLVETARSRFERFEAIVFPGNNHARRTDKSGRFEQSRHESFKDMTLPYPDAITPA